MLVNYDLDLNSWRYDVYVPPSYDGTKPYGVVVYITSDPWPGVVLQTASERQKCHLDRAAECRQSARIPRTATAPRCWRSIAPRNCSTSIRAGFTRPANPAARARPARWRFTIRKSSTAPRLRRDSRFRASMKSRRTTFRTPAASRETYFDYSDQPFLYYYFSTTRSQLRQHHRQGEQAALLYHHALRRLPGGLLRRRLPLRLSSRRGRPAFSTTRPGEHTRTPATPRWRRRSITSTATTSSRSTRTSRRARAVRRDDEHQPVRRLGGRGDRGRQDDLHAHAHARRRGGDEDRHELLLGQRQWLDRALALGGEKRRADQSEDVLSACGSRTRRGAAARRPR